MSGKITTRLLAATALLASMPTSFARSLGTTDPVAHVPHAVAPRSTSQLGIPVLRRPAAEVRVVEVRPNELVVTTLAANSPDWEVDQFVALDETQPDAHFVLMLTGKREGDIYAVAQNTANTLFTDCADPDPAEVGVRPGDRLQIIPFWTFASLFGGDTAVTAADTPSNRQRTGTEILFFSPEGSKLTVSSFFYYKGEEAGGPGWRKSGDDPEILYDHAPIPLYATFQIVNRDRSVQLFAVSGHVPMAASRVAFDPEDNGYENLCLPMIGSATLAESRLLESGAFLASSTPGGRDGDLLIMNDGDGRVSRRMSGHTYFYYDGDKHGGPGWRRLGNPTDIVGDAVVFHAGEGFLLVRKPRDDHRAEEWVFLPPYLD